MRNYDLCKYFGNSTRGKATECEYLPKSASGIRQSSADITLPVMEFEL